MNKNMSSRNTESVTNASNANSPIQDSIAVTTATWEDHATMTEEAMNYYMTGGPTYDNADDNAESMEPIEAVSSDIHELELNQDTDTAETTELDEHISSVEAFEEHINSQVMESPSEVMADVQNAAIVAQEVAANNWYIPYSSLGGVVAVVAAGAACYNVSSSHGNQQTLTVAAVTAGMSTLGSSMVNHMGSGGEVLAINFSPESIMEFLNIFLN